MRRQFLFLASVALGALSGCASMKTTFFTRYEDDTLCKENQHPINGVPVMVKVPTHLEIKVLEVIHIHQHQTELKILNQSARAIRKVEPSLRFTEKMFVVDPKRPFSGSASYGFTFRGAAGKDGKPNAASGHGYLDKLGYKADDETITNATALLANIAPLLTAGAVNAGRDPLPDTIISGVQTTTRTIAFGLFDLSSPSFEDDVRSFLETHINQCSPCSSTEQSVGSSPSIVVNTK